jgi:HEPN domain-containing protein
MGENVIAYFYPQDLDSAPELLDMLMTRSREVIIFNLRKASSLTLGILKSLYPRAELDAVGEGFATSYTEEEADDLVQSFVETMTQVIEMIMVDTS